MAKAPRGIEMTAKVSREAARVLTPAALNFLAGLQRVAAERHVHETPVLTQRPETTAIRDGAWKAAALPRELQDLRSIIVTPVARKAFIGALNSGAKFCIADFADMTAPAWDNFLEGQINLMDRWTSAMEHVDPVTQKRTALSQHLASLMVRPRSLKREEPRIRIDGRPMQAGLLDAGLYLFHNAKTALAKASAPYLCLPGIENASEARLWNDLIIRIQSELGLPLGTIRVMVMIDCLPAAFALDEIAFELRDHVAALAHGGWRFAASFIAHSDSFKAKALGGGDAISSLHEAVSGLMINAAHRRGCLAIGPVISDAAGRKEAARQQAAEAVRAGHDGVLVAHAEAVPLATASFNDDMPTPNQLYVSRDDMNGGHVQILKLPPGTRSEEAFRNNIRAAVIYFESWLGGRGSVVIDGIVEDAARAEFSWLQIWQWLNQAVRLEEGGRVTAAFFDECLAVAVKEIKADAGEDDWRNGRFKEAVQLLKTLCLAEDLASGFEGPGMRKLA